MRLSWNEIRARVSTFASDWEGEGYEKGDTQTFYNEFFEIFGVRRRSVARYERHVQKLDNKAGFIDLFWPGVLIVEQSECDVTSHHGGEPNLSALSLGFGVMLLCLLIAQ